MLATVGIFIGLIVGLILAHELGHFITAKAFGVMVKEFGVGFPPRICSVKKGETVYSLNAVPLGGFNKLSGEEDPEAPRSLSAKPTGIRLLVLSAGSLMNLILPLALFTIAFMYPHDLLIGKVVVEEIAPDSPAAMAGIEYGDQILSINGKTVNNVADLQRYIQINLGRETNFLVERADSSTESINLVPRWRPPEGEGAIGVRVNTLDAAIVRRSEPPWRAAPLAATEYMEAFILFKNAALGAMTGSQTLQVAGPVGIAQVTGEIARAGISPLLEFSAFLSINLAILNILPLPALDGGRIAFVALEKLRRGKRVAPRTQGLVHLIGFVIFIGVIVAVTYNDILRIMSGGSLLP